MPVFDLNKYQEPQQPAPVEKTPEPTEPKQDTPVPTEEQVVLRGPLSNIYAEALSKTIPKVDMVSMEMNPVEMAVIKAYRKEGDEEREDPVVYISTDEMIQRDPNTSLDQLRIALDASKTPGKRRYVVLEGLDKHIGSKTALIVEYAMENATRVFYDRKKFLDFMKARYDFGQS